MASAILSALPVYPCTSVIVSGKVTSGRPVMMKHRDTDELNNRLERFHGERYDFIALVNSPSPGGEAWSGTNTAGFCIMNTATYDLKDDDVPDSEMDREGVLMYRALEICRTLADFEYLLDTLRRPMGVEANFGVIDAYGGAAYYEVNNHAWTKFDVNDAASGYRVVTNFTETGRPEDRKGVDRYIEASYIMEDIISPSIGHKELVNAISRSGAPILRDITSACIVFEGVAPGENPLHTVMWTVLGYPATAVCVPVLVMDEDIIPEYLKRGVFSDNARMCTNALKMKGKDVLEACRDTEVEIDLGFDRVYDSWTAGYFTTTRFKTAYAAFAQQAYETYQENFREYFR